MLFLHCLVVRRGSTRAQQEDAWFKTLASVTMGHKAQKSQIAALERGECSAEGGLHSEFQRPAEDWRPNFPTFADIFRTHLTSGISENVRILPKFSGNFRTAEKPWGVERGWVLETCVMQQGSVSGVTLECPKSCRRWQEERDVSPRKPNFTQLPVFQKPLFTVA